MKAKKGFIKTKGVAGWTIVPYEALIKYRANTEPVAKNEDIVSIGEWRGEKGQILQTKIDTINEIPEVDHSKSDKLLDNLNQNYYNYRKEINSKTPMEKAKRLHFFNLLFWGLTGKHEVPEDIKKRVISIQKKFFEKNKKRIYCSPHLFKELFKESYSNLTVLRIIEKSIDQDIKYANYE